MALQLSKLCDKLATEMLLREALLGLVRGRL